MTLDPNVAPEDPTAGGQAGYEQPPSEGGTQPPTEQPAERTYTQRQWDSEMGRARRSWEFESQRAQERAVAAAREEVMRQFQERQQQQPQATPSSGFEPQVETALKAWFDRQLAPIITPFQEGQIKGEIKQGLADFQMRHSSLSLDEVNDVLDKALSFGEDVVNKAPIDWLLDQAYTALRFGDFDEDTYKQQVIDDYLKNKGNTAARVPRPQTGGGALTGQSRPKDFKTADQVFENMLRQAENE
jgi:hypothetical protein